MPHDVAEKLLIRRCSDACRAKRPHVPIEGAMKDKAAGKTVRVSEHAHKYTKDFVRALVSCARDLTIRGLGRTRRLLSHCLVGESVGDPPVAGDPEVPLHLDARGEPETLRKPDSGPQEPLSNAGWRILEQVHTGLGHPPNKTMVRVLKYGRARPELVRAAASWRCASCEARKKLDRPRPAQPPVTYEVNDVVGLDIVLIRDHAGQKRPCLILICWGTGFQVVTPLGDQTAVALRKAHRWSWKRFMGVPRMVVVDQQRSFSQGWFPKVLQAGGIEVVVTSARSPWQAGRTKQAGGVWKEVFYKVPRVSAGDSR